MTLTFSHDLDGINVDKHTQFGDTVSNGSWDKLFSSLILGQVTYEPTVQVAQVGSKTSIVFNCYPLFSYKSGTS